jgi:catechol 2,3-dioxygenase-like lactoylglutathione lyase family enzyme
MSPVFDHLGFNVADFGKSRDFYAKALAPLGIGSIHGDANWSMFGRDGVGAFWFGETGPVPGPIHLAFHATTRAEVDAFYAAAIAAGGRDNGGPGLRDYQPNYYAAFVFDPDGHNIEAVCYAAE